MDNIKGDPIHSLPGHYPVKNHRVRIRFDELEQEFESELPTTMGRAIAARESDPQAGAHLLDEFSQRCVDKVVETIRDLLKESG